MEFLQIIGDLVLENFAYVFPVMAIFTRVSILAFMLPGLGETAISIRIRLASSLMITWLLTPLVVTAGTNIGVNQWSLAQMALGIGLETLHGFVLGFGLRVMVFALQISGSMISQSLSLTQVFGGGMTSEPNTTIGTLLMLGGVTLLVTLDLHVRAFAMLVQTYEIFPLASTPDMNKLAFWAAAKSMSVFSFAVALALPFLVLNFIYNLMLGFLNKAMPQLMVSFVGMPFVIGAGIVLLALSIGGILITWLNEYNAHMSGLY